MTTADLNAEYRILEDRLLVLQAEKDDLIHQAHGYDSQLRDLREKATAAQKEWMDAAAAEALVGQPDALAQAKFLGLTLPE